MDLSVILPARNEMFLAKTIENILENKRGKTEVIAICDGSWPDPPVPDHPDVTIVKLPTPIGQRAATNAGARLSQAKFIMKADAHCAFDEGFDVKLMDGCQRDWTLVPKMYNLHAFDWQCSGCGHRSYQGPKPETCEQCHEPHPHEMIVVWTPRWRRLTYSWRFDKDLHFQYWLKHRQRPETRRGEFIETMSFIGACWFMYRERYLELGGLDENHGSWGQVGTEMSCKTWLSGGKLLTAKRTWFSHMFRTNNKGFSFPYKISGHSIQKAQEYSRNMWLNNRWPKAKHPLSWLVMRFWPVPGWEDADLEALLAREKLQRVA